MIIEKSFMTREALVAVRQALKDLMLFFPLCGLSYMGEAVSVRGAPIPTLDTDGRRVRVGEKWAVKITNDALVFDLLHEWLHIFYNHVSRRGDRKPEVWGIAADVVVVRDACDILNKAGSKVWTPPTDGVIPPDWAKNMTAEEVYEEIMSNRRAGPGFGGGRHQGDLLAAPSAKESEEFHHMFAEEMAQASLLQQQVHGKTVDEMFGPNIGKRVAEIVSLKAPWNRLLRGSLVSDIGSELPTYSPPNRKFGARLMMPSMKSLKEPTLAILIDISASVGETLFGVFQANVLPAAMRASKVLVVTFDAGVRERVVTTQPSKILKQVQFLTGAHSHTSALEAFEELDKFDPKAMVCFTDGYIVYPKKIYPKMIWVIPQNGNVPPWGRTYKMEVSW